MRAYLVVLDESAEAKCALRYAAVRAARTGGTVEILAVIPTPEFVEWGGVQAAMEQEARLRAEAMVAAASGNLTEVAGLTPKVTVKQGDAVKAISEMLAEREGIVALVLGAATGGSPGPLVTYFAGAAAGALPCPLVIVPGGMDNEAIDRLG